MQHKWAGHSKNIAWLLWEAAEHFGTTEAIEKGAVCVDYATLVDRAAAIAQALLESGVRENDRVAILLERGIDAAAGFFGAVAAGAIAINVNELLRPRQIEHILKHSGATVLLSSLELLEQQPRSISAPEASLLLIDDIPHDGALCPVSRVAGDAAQIIYTSGSTGNPKGVIMSHGALWASVDTITGYLGINADDRIGTVMPFSFTYGFNQLLCAVAKGATLVLEQ